VQYSSVSSMQVHRQARSDELADARDAWFRADYGACLRALDAFEPATGAQRIEAVLLRARSLLRLNDPAATIPLLREAESWVVGVDAVATLRMLLGSAVARVDSEGQGLAILDDSLAYARERNAHPAIVVEINYHRALVYWIRRDLDQAEAIAAAVGRARVDIISARGFQLCGFVSAARGRQAEAYQRFLEALQTLVTCEQRDDQLAANLMHQVSMYEAELHGIVSIPQWRISSPLVMTASPSVAPVQRTQAAFYEMYSALNNGDEDRAFDRARLADSLAPTDAYRSNALATRAKVSRMYGEMRNAREFIRHAADIADGINWDETDDDESLGLLVVAEELRWYDVSRSQALVDRYERICGKQDALLVRAPNALYRAIQDLLIGAVRAMGPERNLDAIARLRRACSAFRSAGYLWRTAWALIELDEAYRRSGVGRPDDYFLASAQQIIQQSFPRSFLARRAGSSGKVSCDVVGLSITAAQREVLRAFCAGNTVDEIAEERRCSRLTVRNHIDAAMKRIGVHSRADLLRELARRGWFGPSDVAPLHGIGRAANATAT
jgi:DNA-binding CsgD family transcriptional regulator